MRVGSLFSGIGGFELGFERAGFDVAFQVEIDPWCRRVLAKHWPNVPRYEDVRHVGSHNLEWVDVLIGGFPCQDISQANTTGAEGIDGDRSGLWSEYARLIDELRPRYAVMENVPALFYRGLDRVLGDLAGMGYDAEWGVLSACMFGASHTRRRVFIVAYPTSAPGTNRLVWRSIGHASGGGQNTTFGRTHWAITPNGPRIIIRLGSEQPDWDCEPDLRRVVNGIPHQLDRLRGLGNAVVPQVAQYVAECVKAHAQSTGVWVEAA